MASMFLSHSPLPLFCQINFTVLIYPRGVANLEPLEYLDNVLLKLLVYHRVLRASIGQCDSLFGV